MVPKVSYLFTLRESCLIQREGFELLLDHSADGMTFGKMLTDHKAHFQRTRKNPPGEFATLWDWAEKHGIAQQAQ